MLRKYGNGELNVTVYVDEKKRLIQFSSEGLKRLSAMKEKIAAHAQEFGCEVDYSWDMKWDITYPGGHKSGDFLTKLEDLIGCYAKQVGFAATTFR